ncbi:unnamed protein product [Gordionus sp. m RMFG-2023]
MTFQVIIIRCINIWRVAIEDNHWIKEYRKSEYIKKKRKSNVKTCPSDRILILNQSSGITTELSNDNPNGTPFSDL